MTRTWPFLMSHGKTGVLMKLGLVMAVLATVTAAGVVRADDALPVVVEYVAPQECAPNEAFHALLQAQLARTPNPERPWRFSVAVRHAEADYEGTLTFEASTRVLRARTCDDLVAALTLVIAMATPATPPVSPVPPVPHAPPPIELPPLTEAARLPAEVPRGVFRDHVEAPVNDAPAWRLAARMQDWTNGAWLSAVGPSGVVSVEPRWGSYRMMFELGAGLLVSSFTGLDNWFPPGTGTTAAHHEIMWGVLDFQTCPLDLELGKSGFAVLGCGRLAGAINHDVTGQSSGALFFGGGGRLRWQSPWHVFVEAHANGVWGTQSSPLYGSPGWMDFGGSAGVRI